MSAPGVGSQQRTPDATDLLGWAAGVNASLGLPTDLPRLVEGGGSVNTVVVVGDGDHRWVIRTPLDPGEASGYAAEAWSSARALEAGVPTAVVRSHGVRQGRPYSVQPFVDGARGDQVPEPGSMWPLLGDHCRRIGAIQPTDDAPEGLFTRFGRDLEAAWQAHLQYNLDALDEGDPLRALGVLSAAEQDRLRSRFRELTTDPMRFGLCHGDLTPRNLLIPRGGAPVLVDWGSAAFGPVPWTDLLHLDRARARDSTVTWPAVVDVAAAAGVDLCDPDIARCYREFRLLQDVDLVRWALDRRPERIPDTVTALRATLDAGQDG